MIIYDLVFQGGASMQLAMEISRDGEIDDISVNIQISPKAIDDHLSQYVNGTTIFMTWV